MAAKGKKHLKSIDSNQDLLDPIALLDEISTLKQQLDEAKTQKTLRDHRQGALARAMQIGYWEWDDSADKPISYSEQMAEIFGVDYRGIETTLGNHEKFMQLVHPDDR